VKKTKARITGSGQDSNEFPLNSVGKKTAIFRVTAYDCSVANW
jgi:hypothetical protein